MRRFIFQPIFIGILLTLTSTAAHGQMSFDQAVREGQALGAAGPQGKEAANDLINNTLSGGVPGLTSQAQSDATRQGNFFLDNPDQLAPQGQSSLNTTDNGRFLQNSYNLRPKITFAPDDPVVTFSQDLASGTQGCITQRVCSKPITETVSSTRQVTCSIDYAETQNQCSYPLPQSTVEWRKWLLIELVGQNGRWDFRLSVDTNGDGAYDLILSNPSGQQNITAFDTNGLDMIAVENFTCGFFNCPKLWALTSTGTWYTPQSGSGNYWTVDRSGPYPNRQTAAGYLKEMARQAFGIPPSELRIEAGSEWFGEGFCFGLDDDRCYSVVWERSYVIPAPPLDPRTIAAACGAYMNDTCRLINEQCDGISCTRSYLCADLSQPVDNCAPYRAQGCLLESETCALADENGLCISRQDLYACTTTTIKEGCAEERLETLCPAAPEGYRCMDPNECADTTSIPNQDLALAASHMSSLNAIEDDSTPDPLIIFTGDPESCRKTLSSSATRDCCAMDTALIGCNANEEQLQSHRNSGMCVEVGTYCSRRVSLGFTTVCVERTTSFCCFSSKLVRIIQVQGRPQLGIPWGTPENPDCRGFAPDELRHINFQQIDFSEYYPDITAIAPDPAELTQKTQGSQALIPQPNSIPSAPPTISQGQVQQDLDTFFGTHAP